MTTQPLRHPSLRPGLRVLPGRKVRTPRLAPWALFVAVALIAFFGLIYARTALDRAAVDLADISREIAGLEAANRQLSLEVARLQSPARIAPLAQEMGMVYPERQRRVVTSGVYEEAPERGAASDSP